MKIIAKARSPLAIGSNNAIKARMATRRIRQELFSRMFLPLNDAWLRQTLSRGARRLHGNRRAQ
ncbi:hypothetical protein ASD46_13040 [Rhizobium sp. Root491]|nr:hypothetical protein ASD46_13040 [Rhizobium sp. Root491]